jgi:hypothetical protein
MMKLGIDVANLVLRVVHNQIYRHKSWLSIRIHINAYSLVSLVLFET